MRLINMSFELLRNRKIIDVLIGDTKVYQEYRMPYYSGPQLCELSTSFGLPQSYAFCLPSNICDKLEISVVQ